MLPNKYEALIGTNVFIPVANSVFVGTVIDVHKAITGNENFIEVSWHTPSCDFPVIFSIKHDIGVKIFFKERDALVRALKIN